MTSRAMNYVPWSIGSFVVVHGGEPPIVCVMGAVQLRLGRHERSFSAQPPALKSPAVASVPLMV